MITEDSLVGYEEWALGMCGLLDEIERISDDKDVRALCRHRFALAEQHGLTIEFLGQVEVGTA
jgi:hypothetical protein